MAPSRLRLIRTGTVPLAPGYVRRDRAGSLLEALGRGVPRERMLACPIGAFLLEHPERGPVLVDTGMHPVVATDPRRNLGAVGAAVARGLRAGPHENVPDALRGWGIEPEDVRLVVMTHLHADHTSAMSTLPGAEFVITPQEWDAAHGRLAALSGYLKQHLPPRAAVRLVDVAAGEPHDGLAHTTDLLGDGSIRLLWTPGHTAGHVSVLAETTAGPVLLAGDATYTLDALDDDVLPWRVHDEAQALETLRELRAFRRAHPEVPVLPTHDAGAWEALAPRFA